MKYIFVLVACVAAVMAAPTKHEAKKDDFRNEFDHLLVVTTLEQFHKGEKELMRLQEEINHLEQSKSKTEQERIVRELDTLIALISGAHQTLERELKRTDLDILERYNYEVALKTGQVLEKDLRQAEAKVKSINTN